MTAQTVRLIWLTGVARPLSPRMQLVARRLLLAVPVLFGVTLLTFFVLNWLPGNAANLLAGPNATPEQIARLQAQLHIDRPATVRYREWLLQVVTGDLGRSLASGQPVAEMLDGRILVTGELVALTFIVSGCVAIPLALLAAHRPGRFLDRQIMLFGMFGLSVASYVLAPVLVLVFSVYLPLFPAIGFVPPNEGWLANLRSLTLPAASLALPLACFYTRFLRSDILEQMSSQDYIATARAKGVGHWRILSHHALRNSLPGLVTVAGINFGALIGGTVVTEQIFALPGIGQLLLQAINIRDAPVVQAIVLLLGVVTVLANLAVDLLYTFLDPRMRHGHR